MIIERAGYKVIAIARPEEAVQIFSASGIDAVVFGDSIHVEQKLDLARTFKRINRLVPIVALGKSSGSQFPSGLVDEQLESLGDPQLLVEALKRVLARDGGGAQTNSGPESPQNSAV
jgi:CheY-like chemotaxis protein